MPRTGRPRIVRVNEHFFDQDTPESHYWAGFILADGNVMEAGRWVLCIGLKIDDLGHLQILEQSLGGRCSARRYARLDVYSKYVVQSLRRFGVVPRKSTEPAIPSVSTIPFLRGMFDGDGCLYIDKRGRLSAHFCGSPLIAEWFIAKLGIPCPSIRIRKRTCYAQWGAHRTAIEVARKLYTNDGPALDRKARIAKVFVDEPVA